MTPHTLRELFQNSVTTYPDNPCFSLFQGERLTYADFEVRVNLLVETFVQAGLSSGDKIALLSNNMPNWGVTYFAATISGMVIVPILSDFSGPELDKLILHCEARALVASDKLFAKVSKDVINTLNLVVRSVNLGVISRRDCAPGTITPPRPKELASIIYTSGTTTQPKGVMLSHRNLCSELKMLDALYPIFPSDLFLSILPLAHTYECTVGMLLPFRQGASVVYIEKAPTASVLLPILGQVHPTMMLSVPLIIEHIFKNKILPRITRNRFLALLYKIRWGRKWLHRRAGKRLMTFFGGHLRYFGIGGAKLDMRVEQFLLDAKFPYSIGYGLTETSPVLAGAIPSMVRLQSTGPMLPGIEARLDNVNPLSGEGEIVVRGPNVMMGYYKNPEATADSFTSDGWFRTKDLGVFDRDGYLYIKGRLTNMILGSSGENIYPEEIENVLNSHPLVSDSLVQEDMGRLVALVFFNREELERKYHAVPEELGQKMEEIKKEIIHYVNARVNTYSRISVVEEQEKEFQKTPTHKIKRFLYNRKK